MLSILSLSFLLYTYMCADGVHYACAADTILLLFIFENSFDAMVIQIKKNYQWHLNTKRLSFDLADLNLRNGGHSHLSSCPSSTVTGIKAKSAILHHTSYRNRHFNQKQETGKIEKCYSSL